MFECLEGNSMVFKCLCISLQCALEILNMWRYEKAEIEERLKREREREVGRATKRKESRRQVNECEDIVRVK